MMLIDEIMNMPREKGGNFSNLFHSLYTWNFPGQQDMHIDKEPLAVSDLKNIHLKRQRGQDRLRQYIGIHKPSCKNYTT
jgi:hypothetical protein